MKYFEEKAEKQSFAPDALLAALFNELYADEPEVRSQTISPSGLACQVSQAWKLLGVMPDKTAESFQSRSFAECGEDRHARIQAFLAKTPYWVDVEEYVKEKKLELEVLEKTGYEVLLYSPKYNVRFRCDGMLLIDGIYYVLEIKTERQIANDKRTEPAEKHLKQGYSYALMMCVDWIMWVYEGRDYLTQKPIAQRVTKDEKAAIEKYLTEIVQLKDTPEKLYMEKKACGGCEYKSFCREYFKALKKGVRIDVSTGTACKSAQ